MSDSSAQSQSTNASRGNDSARSGETEHMRGVIDVTPCAAAADRDGSSCGINPHIFYRCEIDNQAVIANSQTSGVMSATADRKKQIVLSCKVHRANHVGDVRTTGNQPRLLVDHTVVNLACFVVILVGRLYQSSA